MLAAGKTPREAWETLRGQCSDPSVRTALEVLRRSPHGQAVLDRSRQAWAAHGLPPPWEDPDATGPATGPPGRKPDPGTAQAAKFLAAPGAKGHGVRAEQEGPS
jgi:hypothetical protein